ncbi:14655_t:CDS:2, partial [Entrophospora sp. SA101]
MPQRDALKVRVEDRGTLSIAILVEFLSSAYYSSNRETSQMHFNP